MTMQRRHYELIAEIIKDSAPELDAALGYENGASAHQIISTLFCSELRATNPSFNPSRFLRACGVEDGQ